ncbi:MAG: hypothetical protein WCD76_01410 [Pyrinomonadaceae bacterium]
MYTNGDGSNGNGNGNGNGRKRVKLTLSDLNGVDTVDDHPETLGGEADEGSRLDASPGATAAELKRESKQTPPGQAELKDADETLIDDETEENLELLERVEKRKRRTRLLLSFGIIGCAVCALLGVGYLWLFAGSEESYRVRNTSARNRAGEGAANSNTSPQALTVEEITRELNGNRNANSSTVEGQTAPPVSSVQDGATMERGGSPVTSRLPLGDYSTTVVPSPSPQLSQSAAGQNVSGTATGNQIASGETPATGVGDGVNRARAGNATIGSPSPERSIRVSALNNAGANGGRNSASLDNQSRLTSTPAERRTGQVSLPPLGTMLPVRTLGTLYTLRSEGYVRMQLTRAVSGQGWSLPRGTELYGVARSSDFEIGRAYVQIIGFIDPSSNRLVRLQGSVLGSDGADGLRGRKHNLNSGWGRALRIAGAGALEALSTVAAGIGRRPVYVGDVYGSSAPRMTSPLMQELNGIAYRQGRAGFVEVPAGTSGYILVMTSPREIEGVDAGARLPVEDLRRLSDTGQEREATRVSEAELAELMTSGDAEAIRRALPRMTPEMRRVAEIVLAQQ